MVRRRIRTGKQQPHFAGVEQGSDLLARCEPRSDVLEGMGAHHRRHHLVVDGQRHVDGGALDDRRPVLIAERVAEFEAGAQDLCRRQILDVRKFDDQHVLERDARGHDDPGLGIVVQNIAIMQVL